MKVEIQNYDFLLLLLLEATPRVYHKELTKAKVAKSITSERPLNRSKYKYGYVISHKGGSTQAHLESRDGNLALGRYYVDLRNGTGQKVTYFADDLGFHSGVSYSSQNGKGSSNAHIAVGQKALAAAFGDSVGTQGTSLFTPTLLFGKKVLKTALNAVTSKPGGYPPLNFTPVPGGFILTHQSASNGTAEQRGHVSGVSTQEDTLRTSTVPQIQSNVQTFYPTSENAKNIISEVHIESTTPSIQSYTPLPEQSFLFSPNPEGASGLSQQQNTVRVSSHATNTDDLSYSKQKSIEKTIFADVDAQIISEVQKHAEGIIMKDLQRDEQAKQIARLSSSVFQPATVTMQPIVVTNDGETGLNTVLPSTAVPEARKLTESPYSHSGNSIQAEGKNPDQTLEDSGYFRVSLSPSLTSSINVSETSHQSINVESTDRNANSNNSTLCGFNLCEKDNNQIFSVDLSEVKPKNEIQDSGSEASDESGGLGTNKIIRTFYPENKVHDERHYITTIDVQKAIALDVNQNEAGSVLLAQNFPFNKIKPFQEVPPQNPTPQPLPPVPISVTPAPLAPEVSLNLISTPQQPYVSNTVTTAPGLHDLTNQNQAVLNGLNDITSGQYGTSFQDRVGSNRYEYENQLVVPPPPVDLTNPAADVSGQNPQEDFKEVEKSIQELRQQILADIDAQHEEEQRKQNLVDQERKLYFQNLKKVEELKNQNTLSYSLPVLPQSDAIQSTTAPPVSSGTVSNVQLVPQTQYVSSPQISYDSSAQIQYDAPQQAQYEPAQQSGYSQLQQTHYESSAQVPYTQPQQTLFEPSAQSYQTEIKDFRHEVAVPQPHTQQIANLQIYQKPAALSFDPRLYESQTAYQDSNNLQLRTSTYRSPPSSYAASQVGAVAFQTHYAMPRVAAVQVKPKEVQQLAVLNEQVNAVPVGLAAGGLPPAAKIQAGKRILLNNVLPFDYSRYLQLRQPLPLLQTYPVALQSETKLVPEIYPVPIQIPQPYKLEYPELAAVAGKQYHPGLTQRPINKLRVQPLKPSTPDDSGQREAVQNLLSQPQFHRTILYPGFPIENRLQLRHIGKGQISNADQVRSQSVRRAKSLKNLRIEYGFKPPLRPSVEFSEEVKPSIYGPSVQPQ